MKSAWFILSALVAGMLLGIGVDIAAPGAATASLAFVEPVGLLWLNALKMTIVPLVVALLITGITATADAARAGRLASRAVMTFLAAIVLSGLMSLALTPLLLRLFPLSTAAAAALRDGLGGGGETPPSPTFSDFILGLVPTNPIAAAAETAILPLIVFTTVFAFAITRLAPEQRATLSGLFKALGDAMLIVIGWVLALAPLGVFALGYALAVKAGLAAFGGLVHYVLIVSGIGVACIMLALLLAVLVVRIPVTRFVPAMVPTLAVAISTQSSLASLPAMLKASEELGVAPKKADVVLPLAVALFRFTSTAMNLAVVIYVATLFGLELTPWEMAAGLAVAVGAALSAVSLPGSISFVTSIAPIATAMGVPVAPLGLLVAVETFPDIFRTVGNVVADVAATRFAAGEETHAPAGETP
ncbi:dicarboxylate/amino acid:cation symporter [Sphingopyxis alaskensis]|uniref:Sodium:dicarboxylate symporter n=1 Tax=Sphingopyxis alaskensis (strain DSM 13593 / LMG 18877 / RB2256) TaxID=317655 RepID=Q1GUJ5_SPHAL|nr:cation:dicarboxylase symporter family transporter [Sphingopyxis alaskensis]ABF52677.1 sodium:dicarboxylate symporter [Sphingopyxis alaskensis RB2256]MCM3418213.1 dicarboxylate/amino acid:cation symporter [Sphingopyxis alaskensis]